MFLLSKVFIIAEIGQAHEGSLGIAHSYIDALATSGVDAVKFQTHIAHAESSEFEPFRVKFSYEDATRYDYWKRMEFSPEQWLGLRQHCNDKGMEFISSPFSVAAVDLLEEIGVSKYKIGSGEVSNYLMLDRIAKTGKEILLSSGMSSWEELDKTIDFLRPYGNPLSVLQCTTAYPTQPVDWGLEVIPALKERYQLPTGFSDHSGDITAGIAAVALGATILECHVVFDKRMFGPDTPASLTLEQFSQLVKAVRQLEVALSSPSIKADNSRFTELKTIFEKSLAVNKDLPEGHVVSLDDLEAKKPSGKGIPAKDFHRVLHRSLKRDLKAWEFLNEEDLLS